MNSSHTSQAQRGSADAVLRLLTSADAAAYRQVRVQALRESPPAFGSLPEDEPDLSAIAARLAESDERCFFGAFVAGKLVGIIRLSGYEARNERHRAYLAGLYVLPAYRRQGCARALVSNALARAEQTPGMRRVNLTVVTRQEAAVQLYLSLGFRIYGTEQEVFSRDGQFYDEHLMTLELTRQQLSVLPPRVSGP